MKMCSYQSPLGKIFLASRQEKLVGVWIEGQKYFAESIKEEMAECDTPVLAAGKRWLDSYFAGEKPAVSALPLAPEGSEFRRTVWKRLCEIPYGQVATYGEVARLVASDLGRLRMSAQAVGGAVGHNPISIIIPCHRVVGAGGNLTGYGGGIQRKVWLLAHEGLEMSRFYVPEKGTAI